MASCAELGRVPSNGVSARPRRRRSLADQARLSIHQQVAGQWRIASPARPSQLIDECHAIDAHPLGSGSFGEAAITDGKHEQLLVVSPQAIDIVEAAEMRCRPERQGAQAAWATTDQVA